MESIREGTRNQRRLKLPSELRPEDVVAVVDSREQAPLCLSPLQTITGTLATGDYSVRGLEHVVAVERKSLGDLLSCVGRERDRFDREVQRLLAYPTRCLVVESTWYEVEYGDWRRRSELQPSHVVGSLVGWLCLGLPVVMAGDWQQAGHFVSRILFTAARRRWREARALAVGILDDGEPAA
jgi:ERCC4-type nuclease